MALDDSRKARYYINMSFCKPRNSPNPLINALESGEWAPCVESVRVARRPRRHDDSNTRKSHARLQTLSSCQWIGQESRFAFCSAVQPFWQPCYFSRIITSSLLCLGVRNCAGSTICRPPMWFPVVELGSLWCNGSALILILPVIVIQAVEALKPRWRQPNSSAVTL